MAMAITKAARLAHWAASRAGGGVRSSATRYLLWRELNVDVSKYIHTLGIWKTELLNVTKGSGERVALLGPFLITHHLIAHCPQEAYILSVPV